MPNTLENPQEQSLPPIADVDLASENEPSQSAVAAGTVGLIGKTVSWFPSAVVFIALATIGWYGHHNDWQLPSMAMKAETTQANGVAWCDSHGVPEDECIVCRADLIEAGQELTFCREHGVHGCVLCDPSLAQTKRPTQALPSDLSRAARALALMERPANLALGSTAGARIQFATINSVTKAGIEVEPVQRQPLIEDVSAAGEIRYDETLMAEVSPPTDGIVRRVVAKVGDWVEPGDLLAVIDSQEAGRLKSSLLSALLQEELMQERINRVQELAPSGAVSGSRVSEARTELRQATVGVEQAVRAFVNLGLQLDADVLRSASLDEAKSMIRSIGADPSQDAGMNDNLITVIAPLEGRVVDRWVTLGQVVDRGSQMFRIVDTRNVWLDLRVAAERASLVQLGQVVKFTPDGQTKARQGAVSWISTDVDPQTRTVRVRAELANLDENLRNESFGQGQIILRSESDAIVVPKSSLQWDGNGHVVFVRDRQFFEKGRPKFFITRSVRPGVERDGLVEILAGVLPGEVIASSGSDVLRAQLLKGNLGAGCTCGK